MLLQISASGPDAANLSYLLHKHPDRLQRFDLRAGTAQVFYPEVSDTRCTFCLIVDFDPVGMVRGKNRDQGFLLDHYVNDRPYVASSFLSVAMSQVLGTAMSGRCKARPELVDAKLPLSAHLAVLPVRGNEGTPQRIFEPLGYTVEATRHPLDERFPQWGPSRYFSVTIHGEKTLAELLNHLYVLIPVFDDAKHYFVGDDELEKLLAKGAGWLASHPEKKWIARRYLRNRAGLYQQALARLLDEEEVSEEEDPAQAKNQAEESLEKPLRLNDQRHAAVVEALRGSGARRVLDLGCGEGKLMAQLAKVRQFERIVGLDVAVRPLEIAQRRLRLDKQSEGGAERLTLLHGSLMYRDRRMEGFDAAAVVEVIEHLDPPQLMAFERVLFECARPRTVVLTTPNREYNVRWETLPAGSFRHADHRFEWTRQEFQDWCDQVGQRFGYSWQIYPVGPEDESVGAPTQMAVFERQPANATPPPESAAEEP